MISLIFARLSLCQQYGNDTALVNLLKVYKNFYPEIVISWATSNRSNASFVCFAVAQHIQHKLMGF